MLSSRNLILMLLCISVKVVLPQRSKIIMILHRSVIIRIMYGILIVILPSKSLTLRLP